MELYEIFERIIFLKQFIKCYQGWAIGVLVDAQEELKELRQKIKC